MFFALIFFTCPRPAAALRNAPPSRNRFKGEGRRECVEESGGWRALARGRREWRVCVLLGRREWRVGARGRRERGRETERGESEGVRQMEERARA